MKRLYKLISCLVVVVGMIACSSPKIIPDRVLGKIFHDAMLVNAYVQHNRHHLRDSVNIYEPILDKYGYTVEDMHYTINNFARRKSASLGTVTEYMVNLLNEESELLRIDVAKQDTIDNVARRRFTEVIFHDTAIISKVEADSSRLRISIPHARRGMYRVEGSYTLDAKDKGLGRRYGMSWRQGEDQVRDITSSSMIRGRRSKISTDVWFNDEDSLADNLYIDFTRFNLRKNRQKKHPITIHELKVTYSPALDDAVEIIFNEQSQMRIFADTMLNLKLE